MVFFFKTENSNRVIAERQLSREITAFHPASLLFRRSNFLVTISKRVYFHLKCHLARTELCLSPSCITFSLKVLAKLLPSLSLTLVYLGLTLPSLFVTIYCLNQILCLISPCCQSCIFFFCYAIIYKILPLLWFDYHKHTRFFSPWGHWANMSICLRKFFLLERLGSAVELYLGRGSCS